MPVIEEKRLDMGIEAGIHPRRLRTAVVVATKRMVTSVKKQFVIEHPMTQHILKNTQIVYQCY